MCVCTGALSPFGQQVKELIDFTQTIGHSGLAKLLLNDRSQFNYVSSTGSLCVCVFFVFVFSSSFFLRILNIIVTSPSHLHKPMQFDTKNIMANSVFFYFQSNEMPTTINHTIKQAQCPFFVCLLKLFSH